MAQIAAEHATEAARAGDELFGAAEQRANRRTQSLRDAECDAVSVAGNAFGRHAERHRGIEQPGAVRVYGDAVLAAEGVDLRHMIER